MISLHNLAERYHLLPSEILERGNTLDLQVLDIATKWEIRQKQIAEGKLPKSGKDPNAYTVDELQEILKKTKETKNAKTNKGRKK